jgi:hypothetical protein
MGGSSRCGRGGEESSTVGAENAATEEGDNADIGACRVEEAAVDLELVSIIGGSCCTQAAAGTEEAAAGTVEATVALSVNSRQGIVGSKLPAATATDLADEEATSVAAGASDGDVAAGDFGAGSRCEVKADVLTVGSASDGEAADFAF